MIAALGPAWDVDCDHAEYLIGGKIDWEALINKTNGNIEKLNDKKWWLVDFCKFQYKILDENSGSPPVLSHIALLKQHGLWDEYLKTIESLYKDLKTRKRLDKEEYKDKDYNKKKREQAEIRRVISRENKGNEFRR